MGNELVCDIQVGTARQAFHVSADIAGVIGESLRPFSCLPELRVGQNWRVYMIDPISLLTGGRVAPKAVLVRVTGKERIELQGRSVETFVVECQGSRNWVDADGRVLRSQVDLPPFGRITIEDEPFDAAQLTRALETVPSRPPVLRTRPTAGEP